MKVIPGGTTQKKCYRIVRLMCLMAIAASVFPKISRAEGTVNITATNLPSITVNQDGSMVFSQLTFNFHFIYPYDSALNKFANQYFDVTIQDSFENRKQFPVTPDAGKPASFSFSLDYIKTSEMFFNQTAKDKVSQFCKSRQGGGTKVFMLNDVLGPKSWKIEASAYEDWVSQNQPNLHMADGQFVLKAGSLKCIAPIVTPVGTLSIGNASLLDIQHMSVDVQNSGAVLSDIYFLWAQAGSAISSAVTFPAENLPKGGKITATLDLSGFKNASAYTVILSKKRYDVSEMADSKIVPNPYVPKP